MTRIVPAQRAAIGRHRRGLEVILADAPPGAAVIVAGEVPPAACGPPLHVHAASDETFLVLSGVLLVHAGGQVTAISEGGLLHVSGDKPHTFAAAPGSPARFLVLQTPGTSGNPASRQRTHCAPDMGRRATAQTWIQQSMLSDKPSPRPHPTHRTSPPIF
jgi:mannose-6-phosphate isomerase-like protein (cupin superfamily)